MSSGQTFLLLRGLESKLASEGTSTDTDCPMYLNSSNWCMSQWGPVTATVLSDGNRLLRTQDPARSTGTRRTRCTAQPVICPEPTASGTPHLGQMSGWLLQQLFGARKGGPQDSEICTVASAMVLLTCTRRQPMLTALLLHPLWNSLAWARRLVKVYTGNMFTSRIRQRANILVDMVSEYFLFEYGYRLIMDIQGLSCDKNLKLERAQTSWTLAGIRSLHIQPFIKPAVHG